MCPWRGHKRLVTQSYWKWERKELFFEVSQVLQSVVTFMCENFSLSRRLLFVFLKPCHTRQCVVPFGETNVFRSQLHWPRGNFLPLSTNILYPQSKQALLDHSRTWRESLLKNQSPIILYPVISEDTSALMKPTHTGSSDPNCDPNVFSLCGVTCLSNVFLSLLLCWKLCCSRENNILLQDCISPHARNAECWCRTQMWLEWEIEGERKKKGLGQRSYLSGSPPGR